MRTDGVSGAARVQPAEKYLQLAKECRDAARQARESEVKRHYRELAELWERMAKAQLRRRKPLPDVLRPPGKNGR